MVYRVLTARIGTGWEPVLGRRVQKISWPRELQVGGLYFLRPGKLYKAVGKEGSGDDELDRGEAGAGQAV